MNKRNCLFTAVFAFSLISAASVFAQSESQKLAHQTDEKEAPIVYFTKDVSSAGLMKVYKALNQKKQGKVGIKVSFGGPGEDVLKPALLTDLIKATDGTMIDSCGLSGNRWTAEMNLAHARKHGFDKVGPMQMLDEKSDIDMPVKKGYLLKYARTGSHFDEYDTLVSVFKFRMHFLPALDGAIKNVTLCLGSRSGKCLIHSGGTDANHYHNTKPDVLEKSFADALRAAWEEAHQVKMLEYAENLGCGRRNYRLVEIK